MSLVIWAPVIFARLGALAFIRSACKNRTLRTLQKCRTGLSNEILYLRVVRNNVELLQLFRWGTITLYSLHVFERASGA